MDNKDKDQDRPGCGEEPKVETVSAYRDGGDLILVIDGVENRVPGGHLGASLTEDGEVKVFLNAHFRASVLDMSETEPGS